MPPLSQLFQEGFLAQKKPCKAGSSRNGAKKGSPFPLAHPTQPSHSFPQSRESNLLASVTHIAQVALFQDNSCCSKGSLLPARSVFSANERSRNADSKNQLDICNLDLGIPVFYLSLGRKLMSLFLYH